jgi:CNT family concentrative nucleoside transporter
MITERLISFVGLMTLLGIAYALSNNRGAINRRTILWGIGLQLILALMILKEGTLSFVGMFMMIGLILVYLFESTGQSRGWRLPFTAIAVLGLGIGVSALFYAVAPFGVTKIVMWVSVALAVLSIKLKLEALNRIALGAFLTAGFGHCVAFAYDGKALFRDLSDKVTAFLDLSVHGAKFLFGNLADNAYFFPGPDAGWPGFGFQFAFVVLPTIIFFSAFMSVLYYLGIIQVVVGAMAKFMHWTMQTSGSETLSCAANIFVGQTEAPFLVKPFLRGMTPSELHAVMVGGFATIAGGVLAGYVQMGIDAGHLIAASVMAAPATMVLAKLLYPETEHSETAGDVEMPDIQLSDDVVDAAAAGASDGLKLALNVAAMLVAFIALVAFLDMILLWADGVIDGKMLAGTLNEKTREYAGIFPGSLRTLFGTVHAPIAFLLGVPWSESAIVGNLLGVKITLNEFVAYTQLSESIKAGELSERGILIATYALCGFANLSSVGIQIGGISALEPELRPVLARIGFRALLAGTLATFMTAAIAGILV